ncbi:MAG: histidinol dehydrogenase, partial [Mycobacteriaceae bacterium]
MLARIDLRGRTPSIAELRSALPRGEVDVDAVLHTVRPIVEAVRERGVDAVLELSETFDKVRPRSIRVPAEELTRALEQLDPRVRAALEESIARTRRVHADQRRTETRTQVVAGGTVTERWVPVDRVGLYVPGGTAVLASSVVMNVVPAQAAEVAELVVCSPPQADNHGLPDATILAACALLGAQEVWAVGGAQAIALLALGGTDVVTVDGQLELAPVDLITGPGNIYVTAAKRLLRGMVGIDSEAGPTEIAILADDTADPEHVAADLISQAEHDVLAASVLVTTSQRLADAVDRALEPQVAATKHSERVRTALGGRQSGVVLVSTVDDGLRVVNAYAAEHL